MDRQRPPVEGSLPFDVNLGAVAFLLAVIVIAALWWKGYGAECLWHWFHWCSGCRRKAVSCSCPVEFVWTPWDDLSDEERDDAV